MSLRHHEYDVSTVAQLSQELSVLAPGAATIDFANVSFFDSSSISVLMRTYNRLRLADPSTAFSLVNVGPNIARVFKIVALDTIFHVEEPA